MPRFRLRSLLVAVAVAAAFLAMVRADLLVAVWLTCLALPLLAGMGIDFARGPQGRHQIPPRWTVATYLRAVICWVLATLAITLLLAVARR
jgi:hypothetical protein